MTIDRTRVRRPERGLAHARAGDGAALIVAWARGRPGLGQRQGRAHRRPPAHRGARRRVRLRRAQARLGPLDDAPRGRRCSPRLLIPILAGFAACAGASPGSAFQFAADGTIAAYLDLAWRQLQLTTEEIHYVLCPRDRAVGDDAVRVVRGVRAPPAARRGRGHGPRARRSTWRLTSQPQLPYLIAFTAGCPVPAHPDARVRRAGDLDPAPDRRPDDDLRRCTCAAGRCSSSLAMVGLVPAHPARRVERRSPVPGTASTTG